MARVLFLRSREDAAETSAALEARGHEALSLPLQEIVALAGPPPEGVFGGFLVTSANAAAPLAKAFPADGRPVLAVGARTGGVLQAAGFGDVTIGEGDASSLVAPAEAHCRAGGLRLLYAAGRVRSPALETALAASGVGFSVWEVYDTVAVHPSATSVRALLSGAPPDAVLLLSTGQAEAYGRLSGVVPDILGARPQLLCLSARIADALPRELRGAASISDVPKLDALFDRIR